MTEQLVLRGVSPRNLEAIEVVVADGAIVAIRSAETTPDSAPLDWISAGLIDLQVNGFDGHDVNADNPDPDEIVALTHRLFLEGVTSYAPTIVTASHDEVTDRLAAVAAARNQHPLVAHAIGYVHLEGPHLSPQDGPRGVHDAAHIRPPSLDEFVAWQAGSDGLIGMMTLSPHYPGSPAFIAALVARGVHVAIGHTHADGRRSLPRSPLAPGCPPISATARTPCCPGIRTISGPSWPTTP